MNANEFIAVAGTWAARPNSNEASYRSAVSRAYYGAFHIADQLLSDLGLGAPANPSAHAEVSRSLFESGEPDASKAGGMLKDLHSARIRADYHLNKSAWASQRAAMLAVEQAREIEKLLQKCATPTVSVQVKKGVESYRAKLGLL
jgi:uncharacterized protein (UPF0332 family)